MVDWLNLNSGVVMAILTLIYVVATILLVRENRNTVSTQVKAIEQQIKIANRQSALQLLDHRLDALNVLNKWVDTTEKTFDDTVSKSRGSAFILHLVNDSSIDLHLFLKGADRISEQKLSFPRGLFQTREDYYTHYWLGFIKA